MPLCWHNVPSPNHWIDSWRRKACLTHFTQREKPQQAAIVGSIYDRIINFSLHFDTMRRRYVHLPRFLSNNRRFDTPGSGYTDSSLAVLSRTNIHGKACKRTKRSGRRLMEEIEGNLNAHGVGGRPCQASSLIRKSATASICGKMVVTVCLYLNEIRIWSQIVAVSRSTCASKVAGLWSVVKWMERPSFASNFWEFYNMLSHSAVCLCWPDRFWYAGIPRMSCSFAS